MSDPSPVDCGTAAAHADRLWEALQERDLEAAREYHEQIGEFLGEVDDGEWQ